MSWIFNYLYPEYYEELDGIAEVLETDTSFVILLSYILDLTSYCTSIVAKMKDGTLVHQRNLDFLFPNNTRNILYKAHFTKNGKK